MAKATADIRPLARAQTELAIRTLTGVCGSKAAPAAALVSAAQRPARSRLGQGPRSHGPASRKTVAVVARTIGIDTGKNTLHLIGLGDNGAMFCTRRSLGPDRSTA